MSSMVYVAITSRVVARALTYNTMQYNTIQKKGIFPLPNSFLLLVKHPTLWQIDGWLKTTEENKDINSSLIWFQAFKLEAWVPGVWQRGMVHAFNPSSGGRGRWMPTVVSIVSFLWDMVTSETRSQKKKKKKTSMLPSDFITFTVCLTSFCAQKGSNCNRFLHRKGLLNAQMMSRVTQSSQKMRLIIFYQFWIKDYNLWWSKQSEI